jgi:hypothetical protein
MVYDLVETSLTSCECRSFIVRPKVMLDFTPIQLKSCSQGYKCLYSIEFVRSLIETGSDLEDIQ